VGITGAGGALKKVGVKCGARKSQTHGVCQLPAGWGTNHYGIGCCKLHGGNTINHVKSAVKDEYRKLLGRPLEINPLDGLLWCIKIAAGEVKWLSERMAELDESEFVEDTIAGKQFHLYARERRNRMQDLARYSAQAVNLGIAERSVKLAETYGEMLAALIQGILGDLDLTLEQRARVPQVVRRHLIMLDGGQPDVPTADGGERKAIPAVIEA
jgi:hypothetical protein